MSEEFIGYKTLGKIEWSNVLLLKNHLQFEEQLLIQRIAVKCWLN